MLKWHSRWTCKLSPNQSSPRVELCSPFNILSGFAGPPDLGSGLLEICWFVLNMLLHLSSILMCPTPIYSPPPGPHSGGDGGPLRFRQPSLPPGQHGGGGGPRRFGRLPSTFHRTRRIQRALLWKAPFCISIRPQMHRMRGSWTMSPGAEIVMITKSIAAMLV